MNFIEAMKELDTVRDKVEVVRLQERKLYKEHYDLIEKLRLTKITGLPFKVGDEIIINKTIEHADWYGVGKRARITEIGIVAEDRGGRSHSNGVTTRTLDDLHGWHIGAEVEYIESPDDNYYNGKKSWIKVTDHLE